MASHKKKTQNRSDGQHAQLARLLYDSLMNLIESDLTTARIEQLAEFYRGETPEEAERRGDRYREALEIFADMWPEFITRCEEELRGLRSAVLSRAKVSVAEEEQNAMTSLEDIFSKL